ncbi:DUF308 domain-containing protein [Leucobacter allii]|uniref:DUF308 domain-containing protein n=1 Tax=Leucobacter allii TaxID=2932247 RepID=A0ABY4FQV8_9MICO|nr:DUF308 domain-containing protein [Leucobacter allii]UOQ58665.1 DUF308 domain-containing protein [Leucobacter allii]
MIPQPVPFTAASARRRSAPWWALTAVGALVALSGIALLVWPFVAASSLLALLFGAALMLTGLALVVRGGASGPAVIGGVLLGLAGLAAMAFPALTTGAIVAFAGVSLIGAGAIWIAVAARLVGSLRAVVPGAVLLLGGVVALIWPQIALSIVAVVAGLVIVLIGASIVWAAQRLRRAAAGGAARGPVRPGGAAASETIIIVDPER